MDHQSLMRWIWLLAMVMASEGGGLLEGLLESLSKPKGPDCVFSKWDSRGACTRDKNVYCRSSMTTCECGSCLSAFESKIVGGTRVKDHDHCYLVGLLQRGTCRKFCAGTIICDRWVLTAAHCLVGLQAKDIDLLAGILEIDPKDCEKGSAERREVVDVVCHPSYSHELGWPADIALLKVDKPFVRGPTIGIACLPPINFQIDSRLEKQTTITGWGQTEDGTQSKHLLKACTKQMAWSCCDPAVEHLLQMDFSQFCTYDKTAGCCQGDSGGGVEFRHVESNCNVVYGVVSWGPTNCSSGMPDVLTNIHQYLPWIKKVTGDGCQLCHIKST